MAKKIDTGDDDLDEVLEAEEELKGIVAGLLEDGDLGDLVESLAKAMNGGSAYEATWRFRETIGDATETAAPPESEMMATGTQHSKDLVKLVRAKLEDVDAEELVELLVEAMDLPSTQRAIEKLA